MLKLPLDAASRAQACGEGPTLYWCDVRAQPLRRAQAAPGELTTRPLIVWVSSA